MNGIKDVAKLAGVSISTVSNVLNSTKYVSPELVSRVEQAVNDLKYQVNPIAASMKTQKSYTIGVITEDMCGLFYPYVVRGIEEIASQKGYKLIICDVSANSNEKNTKEHEKELFKGLVSSRVDGIIFTSYMSVDEKDKYFVELKKLAGTQNKKIPIVSLERDLTSLGIDSVYFDGFTNAKKAVQHLIDSGCKKIGHIAGPQELYIARERIEGYEKCLTDNDHSYSTKKLITYGDYTHKSGYIRMKELYEKNPDIDGVFCSNDQMAVGALKFLKKQGVAVPSQIKLIGYDDVFISSIVEPSLSTIHIQKNNAGKKAADVLFDRIDNPDDDEFAVGIKLESRLIIRESTSEEYIEDWTINDW